MIFFDNDHPMSMLGNSLNEHLLENLLCGWQRYERSGEQCRFVGTGCIRRGRCSPSTLNGHGQAATEGELGEEGDFTADVSVAMRERWPRLPLWAGRPWACDLAPLSPFCPSPPHCFLAASPSAHGQGLLAFKWPGGGEGT